jgi:mannose-6-phosphate isomerase-like protein (cupin superfamily)
MESAEPHEMEEHGSTNVFLSPVIDIDKSVTMHWMHFDPHGSVGGHTLTSPQLFLIIEGDGWVKSNGIEPIPVMAGDGVFWDMGEWQEAGSEGGMTVILIESKVPDSTAFLARF